MTFNTVARTRAEQLAWADSPIEGDQTPTPGLPSGTVTFAFTDIEGSTALMTRLGDQYGDLLTQHRRIIRERFEAVCGSEIDTQGDAFFFAFRRARDAVRAAVDVQRTHAASRWPEDVDVRVRIGLHTGEPVVGEEGYLGLDVVRAARICTIGRGGQVLLSETTRALVRSTLPPGVSVLQLGERQLKDLDEPERIYELSIEGLDAGDVEARPSSRKSAPWETEIGERVLAACRSAFDDADVDKLAGRALASLEERIGGRVQAALSSTLRR
jgi:class 3 adenylate cyclase